MGYSMKNLRAKNSSVRGFGVNDADYCVRSTIGGKSVLCEFYKTWFHMIERCYSEKWIERNPSYYGCSVFHEWRIFSNFKAWMERQDWQGKQLDKDLLFVGNKIYSPETCVFVDALTNTFVNEYKRGRGEYMIGVDKHTQCNKFRARCNNPFTGKNEHLGLYTSEFDAHLAWKKRKLEHAVVIAATQSDERVASAITDRYA